MNEFDLFEIENVKAIVHRKATAKQPLISDLTFRFFFVPGFFVATCVSVFFLYRTYLVACPLRSIVFCSFCKPWHL